MKRLSIMTCLLVMWASSAGANYIQNGDFEDGWGTPSVIAPNDWAPYYYQIDYFFDGSGLGRNGSAALPIQQGSPSEGNDASVPGAWQSFSIETGDTTIHLEFWLKSDDGATLNARIRELNGDPYYFPRFYNGSDWETPTDPNYIVTNAAWRGNSYQGDFCTRGGIYHTIQAVGTLTWTKYSIDIPVLTGVSDYMVEFMSSVSDPGEKLLVDDVVITPEPATLGLLAVGGVLTLLRRQR